MDTMSPPGGKQWPRAVALLIEAIAGAGAGALLALIGGFAGPALVRGFENGWNDLVASVIGALLGYVVGAPLGVIVSARLLRQRGVIWRSVVGSFAGGVAVALLAEPLRLNQQSWLLMIVLAIVPLIGAVWGFQRRASNRHW